MSSDIDIERLSSNLESIMKIGKVRLILAVEDHIRAMPIPEEVKEEFIYGGRLYRVLQKGESDGD